MTRNITLLLIAIAALLLACHTQPQTTQITVAAAADLQPAFEELGKSFQSETKTKLTLSFGSTGLLAQQIANGAPMDVFAAANVAYIDALEKKGLIVEGTKAIYARGRITLWTTSDASIKPQRLEDLKRAEVKRIAIANPDHAPYGLAAREALEKAGVWDSVKDKLIFGDNIRQTLQFAQTGNVDVAIVALSLSTSSDGSWVLIPEELHNPINQALAVIKGTKHEAEARAFAKFVMSERGRAVLKKYGFE